MAVLVAVSGIVPVGSWSTSSALCEQPSCADVLHATSGEAALRGLGADVAAVAAVHGWSAARLTDTLRNDSTLRVDGGRHLFYAEPAEPVIVPTPTTPLPVDSVPDVFALHTRPGARLVIFIDVDGHTTTGTPWNSSYGSTITSAPFDLDGAPGTFNQTERDRIQRWWLRVAEDYAAWNVDVTTQDPGIEALRRTSSTDTAYGVRVVVSPTNWYSTSAGGVAYVNSFTSTTDTPAFVFTGQLGNGGERPVAEAVSHETGHTLGLSHDGQGTSAYYSGNGAWAPIMGVSYYGALAQWSKGSYPGATNSQDDLAIIAGKLPVLADDIGDDAAGSLAVPADFVASGAIGSRADADVFGITASAGRISATVRPPIGANADLSLALVDANGTVLGYADPPGAAAASVSVTVPAGSYWWRVEGVGMGDLTSGYDDYGSIGRYEITGRSEPAGGTPSSVKTTPVAAPLTFPVSPVAGEPVVFDSGYSYDPDGGPLSDFSWTFTSAPTVETTSSTTRIFTTPGRYTFGLTVRDDEGVTGSVNLTITVRPADTTTTTTTAPTTTTVAPTTTTTIAPTTTTTTAPATTTTTSAPPAPGSTARIVSLTVRMAGSKTPTGTAVMTVATDLGTPVAGATVTGTWTGATSSVGSAVTGADGVGTTASVKPRRGATLAFTVTSVSLPAGSGLRWDGVTLSASAP